MQQFALDWFSGGAVPKARLHNTKRQLDSKPDATGSNEARRIKDRYMASVANGDIFVHGADWEIDFMSAQTMGTEWLEGRRAGLGDISRYFGVPLDLIEAAISAPGSITYQSALQRNLQFLIINLQPAVTKRERNLSRLLPRPRFVKFNTNALLRMDPETQAKVIDMRIKNRTLTNTQARALYDDPPLTQAEIDEFNMIYGPPKTAPAAAPGPGGAQALAWPFGEQVSPFSAIPYPITSHITSEVE